MKEMNPVHVIYNGTAKIWPLVDGTAKAKEMYLLGVETLTEHPETGTNNSVKMNDKGELYAQTYFALSDERLKNIVSNLDVTIEQLAELPLFNFTWKSDDDQSKELTGTSAQAVKSILPNVVSGEQVLTLNYGALGVVAAITAAKEIVELKKEIADLKSKLNV